MTHAITRRRLLAGLGASALAGLWGCGTRSSSGQTPTRDKARATERAAGGKPKRSVTVGHSPGSFQTRAPVSVRVRSA